MIAIYNPATIFVEVYSATKALIAHDLGCPQSWVNITVDVVEERPIPRIAVAAPPDGADLVGPDCPLFGPAASERVLEVIKMHGVKAADEFNTRLQMAFPK